MSFIDLLVEQKITEAIERGELDPGPLKGKPLPDIDRQRRGGWWAEEFVKRERSRVVREAAEDELTRWRHRFRNAPDEASLAALLDEAAAWAAATNRRMRDDDALVPFDAEAVNAWRATRRR